MSPLFLLAMVVAPGPICQSEDMEQRFVVACAEDVSMDFCRCVWGELAERFTCNELASKKASRETKLEACLACGGCRKSNSQ